MVMVLAALLGVAVEFAYASVGPSLASKSADPARVTEARFSFPDAHIGAMLACPFDGFGYMACSSPPTYGSLTAGGHTFSATGSAERSSNWGGNGREPPSIKITSPRNGWIYGRRLWSTGCGRRQPGVCGTATESRGLASVRISIRRNATGRYWSGTRFNARTQVYLRASLSARRRRGPPRRREWFYAIGLPSRDGTYTLVVRADDTRRNAALPRDRANSLFTVDARPPTPVITSRPRNRSTSRSAQFSFRANEQGTRFRCHLDLSPSLACASHISYRGLGVGVHTFTVAAVDGAGNVSISRYSWRIVLPLPLHLSGEVATSSAMLYPGLAALAISVTLSNRNTVAIHVTEVTTRLQSTGAPGCSARWFRVSQARIPLGGIAVPAHGSVTLPVQGATAPTIRLVESGTNQDACENARLALAYSGGAHA
jgi:hypothetical protein